MEKTETGELRSKLDFFFHNSAGDHKLDFYHGLLQKGFHYQSHG